ncbi:hypothetical protein BP5796_11142 [Coleophoma crateriformis]|uniref:Nuclear pore complex protein Nup85 n=1 Tax=Coleophoma crateriformis TaxID=565419 RepID=A0A3D8QMG9_9HELO|nr:hypothetical protein BP5796_11142 [Coleophoma crateriformis]
MSGFQVPLSSSPAPSTPDRRSRNSNQFLFGQSNPSTTPAGPPPPSSAGSFTPADPPPSSVFGSSVLASAAPVRPLSFAQQSSFNSSPLKFDSPKQSTASFSRPQGRFQRQSSSLSQEIQSSPQRGFQDPTYGSDEDEDENEDEEYSEEEYDEQDSRQEDYTDEDADAMTDEEGPYEQDEDMEESPEGTPVPGTRGHQKSTSDLQLSSPARSHGQESLDLRESFGNSQPGPKPFAFSRVAKDLYGQLGSPMVAESDDLVISTESVVTKLYENSNVETSLIMIPKELVRMWAMYDRNTGHYNTEEYTAVIGPGPRASAFTKANFLAGLTLRIHHSTEQDPRGFGLVNKPLPQIMLEWMDEYHNPYPSQFQEIQTHRPSPAHHNLFWDTILNGLLRGKVVAVVELLKDAGWRYADTGSNDLRDKSGQTGFSGLALTNVEKVIGAACRVLQQCPAVHGDWDIRGSDWTLFRLQVSQGIEDLKRFAEGRDSSHQELLTQGDDFGLSSTGGAFSKTARKAESRVPWNIYQNLLTLYGLVSGEATSIIENAQDWCEATIGLVVWWDEGKNDRRLALGRSQTGYRASSRESEADGYMRKLRRSFETAIAKSTDFQVNTMSPIEVSLASLFEGDNEAVIGFLRAWSGPISSAVAEVASLAGWLPPAEPGNLITMDSLDQDDLDLLGINPSPSKADGVKDLTLITYAKALSQREQITTLAGGGVPIIKEGWELAISILGRLDSATRSEEVVGEFLNRFQLQSGPTVEKLWRLLNDLDMIEHAEATAEAYADSLAEESHKYGEALWYYALSHKADKVKDILDLLISISLIQSTAYPPQDEMDSYLADLISAPRKTLVNMANMDVDAAELIHKLLSGYATLRRFFSLRDGTVPTTGDRPMGMIARKREALKCLLAVISSSGDNIQGGLYDEGRGAVVSVDFLLALLGEAMVFVNQSNSSLSTAQVDVLLKTIEDLQTVGSRVYTACDEFFKTVLASAQGLKGSTPMDMLRKSTSNLSASSNFSLVGSSMLASQFQKSIGHSGVLVKGNIKRGWDWRQGLTANTTGEEILRILRLGLAKDLARAWLVEADSRM